MEPQPVEGCFHTEQAGIYPKYGDSSKKKIFIF
jgi:hypothetical protein